MRGSRCGGLRSRGVGRSGRDAGQAGTRADRDAALGLLAEAAPAAARLGMTPFSGRISQLRGHLRSPGQAGEDLSPREAQVAQLVGRGMTNRQIATALVISERTAQNHVQHILLKLGMSNRARSRRGPRPGRPAAAASNEHPG